MKLTLIDEPGSSLRYYVPPGSTLGKDYPIPEEARRIIERVILSEIRKYGYH